MEPKTNNNKFARRLAIVSWLKTRAGDTFTFEEFMARFADEYGGKYKSHTLAATLRQVRIQLQQQGVEITRQTSRGRGHKAVFFVDAKILQI